jgi:hypothetical protein
MMKSVDMLLLERERILLHKSLMNKTVEKGGFDDSCAVSCWES